MLCLICVLISKDIGDRLKNLLVGRENTLGGVGLQILFSMEQLLSAITLIKNLIIKYSVILEGEFASRTGENHWRPVISPDEHLATDFLYPA